MAEQELEPQTTARSSWSGRSIVLGLLAAGQLAFAAALSPMGVRSGQWSVAWLPDPDFLVFVASGATLIYPLFLYPLWASLGYGHGLRRFATTLVLCFAFVSAVTVRGLCRLSTPSWVRDTVFAMEVVSLLGMLLLFSLMSLAFWLVRRLSRWRIGRTGDSPSPYVPMRRVQFRLRHLFECMAAAACFAAVYRYYFPDGVVVPAELVANGRYAIEMFGRGMRFGILVVLPTTLVPCGILAFRSGGKPIVHLIGATISWIGFEFALVRFGGILRPVIWSEIIALQLGASASGLISALVLRSCGYRIFRVEREKSCGGVAHGGTP